MASYPHSLFELQEPLVLWGRWFRQAPESSSWSALVSKTSRLNPWFEEAMLRYAVLAWADALSEQGVARWLKEAETFHKDRPLGKDIGLVLAGNLPLVGLWVRLLHIPSAWLYPGILVISTVGVYGASNSLFDVGLLYVFGLLGYGMRRFDFPVAPLVVGLILGPMLEQSMRQALTISQGQWSTFVTRPLSASLLAIARALMIGPVLWRIFRKP